MTQTATAWVVFQLTGSAFWLGVVGFISQVPSLLLMPFAGVWVDRVDRFKLLKWTQILAMVQSLALAAAAFAGVLHLPLLIGLSIFQAVIVAFDYPVRQAFTVQLAESREHLSTVIGMNSSMFHLARLIGPATAGFVLAAVGPAWCFLVDGLSYIAVLWALHRMTLKPVVRIPQEGSALEGLKEGFRYIGAHYSVRWLLIISALFSVFGYSYGVLAPAFAQQVFGGDARTLGFLMSASALGAVCGAFYLANRQSIAGIGNVIITGGLMLSAALLIFSHSTWLPLSLAALALAGAGGTSLMASCNTLIQNLVDEEKRGRVMSLFAVAFRGGLPVGSLIIGLVAARVGLAPSLSVCAAVCALGTLMIIRLRPGIREHARSVLSKNGTTRPQEN